MARKLWTATAVLVLLAVIGKFYARPVLAQVRAALVENIDEPGHNAFALSGGSTYSFYSFTVPAGKRYIIDQYSAACTVASSTQLTLLEVDTTVGGTLVTVSAPAHVLNANSPQTYRWSATGLGPVYSDPGSAITLYADVLAPQTFGSSDIKGCNFYIQGHAVNM